GADKTMRGRSEAVLEEARGPVALALQQQRGHAEAHRGAFGRRVELRDPGLDVGEPPRAGLLAGDEPPGPRAEPRAGRLAGQVQRHVEAPGEGGMLEGADVEEVTVLAVEVLL